MSRIGRIPIPVPPGTVVTINRNEVTVKGPRGELQRRCHPDMVISLENNNLVVTRPSDSRQHRALHGLTRSLLANMVEGVTKGFQKDLEVVGVGYRVSKTGDKIAVRAGFSHPVELEPVPGIKLDIEGANRIKVIGIDKELVGETAAKIRGLRLRDAFKGKGIRYVGERIQLKAGKTGKAIGSKTA
ncbi:MAG: 50S ribosomal protein L6 [Chloroflexi bacterium]|nr:50S ribosomal protein L6 [Chloroflexota bacterium]